MFTTADASVNASLVIDDIRTKEKIYSLCRVVAGYSWEWKSRECTTLDQAISQGLEDIELDGEKYVWNMSNQEWILREGAVNEIGCLCIVKTKRGVCFDETI